MSHAPTNRNDDPVTLVEPVRPDLSLRDASPSIPSLNRLQILIAARDEEPVIHRLLERLHTELEPGDELHVVADHCADATADIALGAGVQTHVRSTGNPGKGASISWWLERSANPHIDWVVVLDADSIVQPGTLRRLRRIHLNQNCAYQLPVVPVHDRNGSVGRLAGYSEQIDQKGFEAWIARLGGSVRLRGTGMLIPRRLLSQYGSELCTNVEDAELTLKLLADRVPIRRLKVGAIIDPKPATSKEAVLQRGRWLRGQWELMLRQRGLIARCILAGPATWLTLESIFAKPRSIFIPAKLLLVAALAGLPGSGLEVLAAAFLVLWLALDIYRLCSGVGKVPGRRECVAVAFSLPGFLWVWIRAFVQALRLGRSWPRIRTTSVEADGAESVRPT